MSLSHGRGKESFRAFNRALKTEVKDIIQGIAEGMLYTQSDVFRFLDTIVNEYIAFLRAEELDVETWTNRAVDSAMKQYNKILDKYDLEKGGTFEEEEQEEIKEEREEPEERPEEDGTLFGYEIMTPENKGTIRRRGKPRKRIFLTLEELEQYIAEVPYIIAIQILRRDDGGVNYRVWVEAAKDKKKKKNAS